MSKFNLALPSEAEIQSLAVQRLRLDAECLHCGFDPASWEERAEGARDMDRHLRRDALLRGIEARQGTVTPKQPYHYSSRLVTEQAAQRFFDLVALIEPQLRGRFTAKEFDIILNSTCTTLWYWDQYTTVASMVADNKGVRSLDKLTKGSALRTVLTKLLALTPAEDAVLVDVCERIWRGHDNPLA